MISRPLIPLLIGLALGLSSCAAPAATQEPTQGLSVVATTPILADITEQVAGDRARVRALIPPGADPHTHEPGLRAVRDIANADLALRTGLLLEPASLTATVEQSTPEDTPVVAVAEEISRYGVELIPLVENVTLDAVWLGLRVQGGDEQVRLRLDKVRGPGEVAAYITTTFGLPEVVFNSADRTAANTTVLPADAHTHVSWAFTDPGVYELDFHAEVPGHVVDPTTVTVAVGVDGATGTSISTPEVVDAGHVDITADLHEGAITLLRDARHGAREALNPARTVIAVPGTTLQPIPGDPAFRFLGRPGQETYLLPQAVLGRHVHGEIDPHVWHDIGAVQAMVQVIRDELIAVDPAGAPHYHQHGADYLAALDTTDRYVRERIATIPPQHRHLVTSHHGYAYLGRAYGLRIAGFVSPNPAVEPSPRDLTALTRTLQNLRVPAVFLEPHLAARPTPLTQTAHRLGVRVCPIHGDTLDADAPDYLTFMTSNADSLAECLA
ncbi:MAG: anchored repeat ABC transporter, substrate-binding protein [Corynebacterium sp.]|uniref:anchored repeat ABC transporter, substrate-binding protein n=1 Tax=Corynebacterium sp. TaxID=1720 RepID=UPI0026E07A67|nr:anchored repeat ABC transporter, substrate-binding protein [Corynebacterium sp.]MDO5671055.1 anchored repeat ABC transporter, substrate-binding protein [Corynebacterium sp.]